MTLKVVVYMASGLVFLICLYSFLYGTKLLQGRFENDPIFWYFLAKGIFCSLSLYLSYQVIDILKNRIK